MAADSLLESWLLQDIGSELDSLVAWFKLHKGGVKHEGERGETEIDDEEKYEFDGKLFRVNNIIASPRWVVITSWPNPHKPQCLLADSTTSMAATFDSSAISVLDRTSRTGTFIDIASFNIVFSLHQEQEKQLRLQVNSCTVGTGPSTSTSTNSQPIHQSKRVQNTLRKLRNLHDGLSDDSELDELDDEERIPGDTGLATAVEPASNPLPKSAFAALSKPSSNTSKDIPPPKMRSRPSLTEPIAPGLSIQHGINLGPPVQRAPAVNPYTSTNQAATLLSILQHKKPAAPRVVDPALMFSGFLPQPPLASLEKGNSLEDLLKNGGQQQAFTRDKHSEGQQSAVGLYTQDSNAMMTQLPDPFERDAQSSEAITQLPEDVNSQSSDILSQGPADPVEPVYIPQTQNDLNAMIASVEDEDGANQNEKSEPQVMSIDTDHKNEGEVNEGDHLESKDSLHKQVPVDDQFPLATVKVQSATGDRMPHPIYIKYAYRRLPPIQESNSVITQEPVRSMTENKQRSTLDTNQEIVSGFERNITSDSEQESSSDSEHDDGSADQEIASDTELPTRLPPSTSFPNHTEISEPDSSAPLEWPSSPPRPRQHSPRRSEYLPPGSSASAHKSPSPHRTNADVEMQEDSDLEHVGDALNIEQCQPANEYRIDESDQQRHYAEEPRIGLSTEKCPSVDDEAVGDDFDTDQGFVANNQKGVQGSYSQSYALRQYNPPHNQEGVELSYDLGTPSKHVLVEASPFASASASKIKRELSPEQGQANKRTKWDWSPSKEPLTENPHAVAMRRKLEFLKNARNRDVGRVGSDDPPQSALKHQPQPASKEQQMIDTAEAAEENVITISSESESDLDSESESESVSGVQPGSRVSNGLKRKQDEDGEGKGPGLNELTERQADLQQEAKRPRHHSSTNPVPAAEPVPVVKPKPVIEPVPSLVVAAMNPDRAAIISSKVPSPSSLNGRSRESTSTSDADEITPQRLKELEGLAEPQRSVEWLKAIYVRDPSSKVKQNEVFKAYKTAFANTKVKPKTGKDFLNLIPVLFPGSSITRLEDDEKTGSYWVRGILQRHKVSVASSVAGTPVPAKVNVVARNNITSKIMASQAAAAAVAEYSPPTMSPARVNKASPTAPTAPRATWWLKQQLQILQQQKQKQEQTQEQTQNQQEATRKASQTPPMLNGGGVGAGAAAAAHPSSVRTMAPPAPHTSLKSPHKHPKPSVANATAGGSDGNNGKKKGKSSRSSRNNSNRNLVLVDRLLDPELREEPDRMDRDRWSEFAHRYNMLGKQHGDGDGGNREEEDANGRDQNNTDQGWTRGRRRRDVNVLGWSLGGKKK